LRMSEGRHLSSCSNLEAVIRGGLGRGEQDVRLKQETPHLKLSLLSLKGLIVLSLFSFTV